MVINKVVNKFVLVKPDKYLQFKKLQEENKDRIVPCNIYVDKEDGKVYFIE